VSLKLNADKALTNFPSYYEILLDVHGHKILCRVAHSSQN